MPDLVIVEPSGAAEPANLLCAMPYYRGRPVESTRWIAVLDLCWPNILIRSEK